MRCVRNWRWVNLWNRNLRIKQKKAVCTPENRGANPIISRRRANNNSCHGMEWVISYLFVSLFHNLSRNVKYITSTVQNYKFPCIKGKRSQPSLETINSGQTKASLPVGFGFQVYLKPNRRRFVQAFGMKLGYPISSSNNTSADNPQIRMFSTGVYLGKQVKQYISYISYKGYTLYKHAKYRKSLYQHLLQCWYNMHCWNSVIKNSLDIPTPKQLEIMQILCIIPGRVVYKYEVSPHIWADLLELSTWPPFAHRHYSIPLGKCCSGTSSIGPGNPWN